MSIRRREQSLAPAIDPGVFERRAVAALAYGLLTAWRPPGSVRAREVTRSTAFANGYAFESVRLEGGYPDTLLAVFFRDVTRGALLFGWRVRFWAFLDHCSDAGASTAADPVLPGEPERFGDRLWEVFADRDLDAAVAEPHLPATLDCDPYGVTWLSPAGTDLYPGPDEGTQTPWLGKTRGSPPTQPDTATAPRTPAATGRAGAAASPPPNTPEFEQRALATFADQLLTWWERTGPRGRELTRSTAFANGYAFESLRLEGPYPDTVLNLFFRDITRSQLLFGWRVPVWAWKRIPGVDPEGHGYELWGEFHNRDLDEAIAEPDLPATLDCNPHGVTWLWKEGTVRYHGSEEPVQAPWLGMLRHPNENDHASN